MLEEIWDMLTKKHIKKYGYSGSLIRALRIKNSITRDRLAELLKKRKSTVEKLENTDIIGIKLAKNLMFIFGLEDWRVLRNKEANMVHIKDK